jgi:hypothetical protein
LPFVGLICGFILLKECNAPPLLPILTNTGRSKKTSEYFSDNLILCASTA